MHYFFILHALFSYFKMLFLIHDHLCFLLCFLFDILLFSHKQLGLRFTLRYFLHRRVKGSDPIFSYWYPNVTASLLKQLSFRIELFLHFCWRSINYKGVDQFLNSILLHLSNLMLITCWLHCFNFIVCHEIR